MLSFKATAVGSDVIGSCYWLVSITWSLRPTIQAIINVWGENSPAGDHREHAQANFSSLTGQSPQTNFRLAFSQIYCIHITVDLTIVSRRRKKNYQVLTDDKIAPPFQSFYFILSG